MTRTQLLLTQLAEEATEVAHRALKAVRFGPNEVQPGQELTNAERVNLEMMDLRTLHQMLVADGVLPEISRGALLAHTEYKTEKVEKYLLFSFGVTGHPEAT